MGAVRKLLFFHKRVFLQPVQQLRAVGADHPGLRVVDVRVDEAGQDQLARVIVGRGVGGRRRRDFARFARGDDQAILDPDGASSTS